MSSLTDRQSLGEAIRDLHRAAVNVRWQVEQLIGTTSDTKPTPEAVSLELDKLRVAAERINHALVTEGL